MVSSYFDLVIAYGDQYETLGFRDLIEVKARGERDLDVVLKNPEYAITVLFARWRAATVPAAIASSRCNTR